MAATLRKQLAALKEAETAPAAATLDDIATKIAEIAALADSLDKPLDENAQLYELAVVEVTRLRTGIEAVGSAVESLASDPPPTAAAARGTATVALEKLTVVDERCQDLLVPHLVRARLANMTVGRPLEFVEIFGDAPPSLERRTALLKELAALGSYVDQGVVDVNRQIIWRKSGNATIRTLSALSPLLFAGLSILLLLGIGSLGLLDDSPLDDGRNLAEAFVVVLLGVVAHLFVENVKLSQAQDAPILAIGDFIDWLHLRWAGIGGTFVSILITVIGMQLAVDKDPLDSGWDTASLYFFAGYSIDSVAGIFLTRFGTSATGGVSGLLARLNPTGTP